MKASSYIFYFSDLVIIEYPSDRFTYEQAERKAKQRATELKVTITRVQFYYGCTP